MCIRDRLLIGIILLYYNSTMNTYALEEKNEKIQAELEAEKNYSSGLLAGIQGVLGTEPVSEAGNDSIYKDGTYTGDAKGYGGNIKVQVVIAGGEITNIEVLSAKDEDEAYYNTAIRIIDNMLDKQTPNVDTISSATYTSTGIKNAVIAALKQAVK